MNIMNTMELTLQKGPPSVAPQITSEKAVTWPDEFRRPVDATLHLGTLLPSLTGSVMRGVHHGPDFID